MRVSMIWVAALALSACNDTNLANTGQQIGADADNAMANVREDAEQIGDNFENVAARADNAVEGAANSVDRQVDKVENAADAAERELEK